MASRKVPSLSPWTLERFGHTARRLAQANPVVIDLIGKSKPLRVGVSFLDDVFDGRETWVPASKLVSYWSAVERHNANHAALAALVRQGRPYGPLFHCHRCLEQRFLRHGSFIHPRSAEWGLLTMTRPDLIGTQNSAGAPPNSKPKSGLTHGNHLRARALKALARRVRGLFRTPNSLRTYDAKRRYPEA